jgi:hypothetical protein
MSNFKIKLNEAVELEKTIQDKLIRYQQTLKNENSVPSGQKRNYDLKKIFKDEEDLRQKMIILKLFIQGANMSKIEGEERPIAFYILLLSEKKRQLNNWKIIPTDEGPLIFNKYTVKYTCIYNSKDKNELIEKLNKECREISNKLTELNAKVLIPDLPFDPSKI